MKTKYVFIAIIFLFSISTNAQKTNKIASKKLTSIYTFSIFPKNQNSFSAINKKLKLNNFSFTFINVFDADFNQLSIETNNDYKTSSIFIDDDFNRFQNENLLKGFLIKNDPTRWNFHCPPPFSVQSTAQKITN